MPAMRCSALVASLASVVLACGGDTGDPKIGECEDYCTLIEQHCRGAVAQYGDGASCRATCMAMPLGDPETHSGHSIACRTFQAAAAELPDSALCPTAGPGGAGTCGNDCESFCAMADVICTGDNQSYASVAECMTACAGFTSVPPFDSAIIEGNTFECRLYHLTAASVNPGTHCPHIQPTSSTCRTAPI